MHNFVEVILFNQQWKFKDELLERAHLELKFFCDFNKNKIPYFDFLSKYHIRCWKDKVILLSELDYWDVENQVCLATVEDALEYWREINKQD